MKQLSDLIQVLLLDGSALGFICWAIALAVLTQFAKLCIAPIKLLVYLWRHRLTVLIRPSKSGLALLLASSFVCWGLRAQLSDKIQYMEQRYIDPVYEIADTSTHTMAIYEAQLRKQVDAYEYEIIRRRTREIAVKVGSTPLAIYEVAYSECGMDPFRVRKDGVAAGWIQFTNAGLNKLTISGQPATLDAVKRACASRDAALIMDLTEQYLVSRSAGKALPRAADVYVCVFAPGYIGQPDNKPLYEGWKNPAYYLNAGLDGYYTQSVGGKAQIFRSELKCDGKITTHDLDLALQCKKSRLIQAYDFKDSTL